MQKLDVPLAEATTSSLEALKAYSLGNKAGNEKGNAAALPYDQRAIELDPNFALGYAAVGTDYDNLTQVGRASEYYTKAFQLREHASEREKLTIAAYYYSTVTGELDKAGQTYQEYIESYPRSAGAYVNLGNVYGEEGQYEKAAEVTRQASRLAPNRSASYVNLANFTLAMQRFDETRQSIHEEQARKLDDMQFLLTAEPDGVVVGDIQSELDIPNSTLSHHLDKLKNEDLVVVRREGRFLWYRANTAALKDLLGFLYAECCARNRVVAPKDVISISK